MMWGERDVSYYFKEDHHAYDWENLQRKDEKISLDRTDGTKDNLKNMGTAVRSIGFCDRGGQSVGISSWTQPTVRLRAPGSRCQMGALAISICEYCSL